MSLYEILWFLKYNLYLVCNSDNYEILIKNKFCTLFSNLNFCTVSTFGNYDFESDLGKQLHFVEYLFNIIFIKID